MASARVASSLLVLLAGGCAAIAGLDGDFSVAGDSSPSGAPAGHAGAGGAGATTSGTGGGGGTSSTGGGGGTSSTGGGGAAPTPGSCLELLQAVPTTSSGRYGIDVDGDGGTPPFDVSCDMDTDGGGWTLVYNRINAYFTPDHMYHRLPTNAGPTLTDNSTSWFILSQATRWRWQVSVDGGSTFRQLVTAIPSEARQTVHASLTDVPVAQVYDNTTGAAGPFYLQTMTLADACAFGCSSSSGTWFGLVNATQGSGDRTNPGIGGHSDQCDLDAFALPADAYTWGGDDLELYWTDYKDVQGNGIGGTNCMPSGPTDLYRMRIWVR